MENNATRTFREHLLKQTIAWCVERSPFYRASFGNLASTFRGIDDLHHLPVLFRDDVIEHQKDLICQQQQPSSVQYTTGTSGKFMQMFRGPEELAFIWNFFSHRIALKSSDDKPRPLYLSLTSAYHGSPTPVPSGAYIINAGIYDKTQAQQTRVILDYQYTLPGVEPQISAVIGAEVLIKALTAYLLNDGFDLRGSSVKHLILTGGYLSTSRKRQLSNLWGASVHDCYSMSEIFGGAKEVGIGGPWIFDTEIIPEVVHPRTLEVLNEGIGVLVLTGLYPFMQMMPLVRYYTGDLVEIVQSPLKSSPDLLVRFMGRQRRSIIDDTGSEVVPLLLAGPLYEILEALPDLMITSRYLDLDAGANLELVGKFHYAVESSSSTGTQPEHITLSLGLRYEPWLYKDRVTSLVTQVRSEIYAKFPALRERVEQSKLDFTIEVLHGSKVSPYNAK